MISLFVNFQLDILFECLVALIAFDLNKLLLHLRCLPCDGDLFGQLSSHHGKLVSFTGFVNFFPINRWKSRSFTDESRSLLHVLGHIGHVGLVVDLLHVLVHLVRVEEDHLPAELALVVDQLDDLRPRAPIQPLVLGELGGGMVRAEVFPQARHKDNPVAEVAEPLDRLVGIIAESFGRSHLARFF